MKCDIIRDLLPLCLDGLASRESRREVEEHLAGCPACREAAQGMKARIETPLPPLCPDTIRPFRKLRRRMVLAVLAIILACTLAAGCVFFCGVGWQVDSGSVRMESSVQNGILTLDFMLRDGGILHAVSRLESPGGAWSIEFCERLSFPFDDRGSNPERCFWGLHTGDQDGNPILLPQSVVLRFQDKSGVLSIPDLLLEAQR